MGAANLQLKFAWHRHVRYVLMVCVLLCGSTFAQGVDTDIDADGISNGQDNCLEFANPNQVDADNDGYGNFCDADLNNDLVVNFFDFIIFSSLFLSADPVADFNSNGVVNFLDYFLIINNFLLPPGPSGVATFSLDFELVEIYQGVVAGKPMILREAPGAPGRWYMLTRAGRIISFLKDDSTTVSTPVLDIVASVSTEFEGGALGMTFDPDFQNNGFLYVSYTTFGPNPQTPLISRVSRFATSEVNGVAIADPASEVIIISVDQPFTNHNGGNIEFGPDGFLYWGLGDGGSFGDPRRNGQNTSNLLATMVRIDVDVTPQEISAGTTYKIPGDNPFAMNTDCTDGCPEIFAWGLRNPWRFSFDQATGDLWVGDVGESTREEISIVENGKNYGWRCMEGDQVFNLLGCDPGAVFEDPVFVYDRTAGVSVTGGYVYRGNVTPQLHGTYFFADFGTGAIWALYQGDYVGLLIGSGALITGFAEDSDGELYVLDLGFGTNGKIYRLEANPPVP